MDESKKLANALEKVEAVYADYEPVHKELCKHQKALVERSREAYLIGLEMLTGVKVVDSTCIAVVDCSQNPRSVLRKLSQEFNEFEKLGSYEITNVIFDPREFKIRIYAKHKE